MAPRIIQGRPSQKPISKVEITDKVTKETHKNAPRMGHKAWGAAARGVVAPSGRNPPAPKVPQNTPKKVPRIVEAVKNTAEKVKNAGKKVLKGAGAVAKEAAKEAIKHGVNKGLDYAATLHPVAGLAIGAARYFHNKSKENKAHEKMLPKK